MAEQTSSKAGPILFAVVAVAILIFFYWFLTNTG